MKVLIANRGEIAARIRHTLDRMGIESVCVYTQIDGDTVIQPAIRIGSYLNGEEIINAAQKSGCDAIHPGYGFLSENPNFVAACEQAGLTFIGPSSRVVADMGEKIRARELAQEAGLPVIPGGANDLLSLAETIGFPLLVKPSAGGGGKGLHLVHSQTELETVLPIAEREAVAAFGDGTLFLERYIARPRHIEFQIVADHYGNVRHLGERECSLQRRHQKVVEEAPSPVVTSEMRQRMGTAAVDLAKRIGYRNVGTVEFLVSAEDPDKFYFIEMNTRLQVEHRVTELVTGLDLVEVQVRIAQGEKLDAVVNHVEHEGHSIQARIYAEDPQNGFLPTGGLLIDFQPPSNVLIDTVLYPGVRVHSTYDPMLAKVVSHGASRDEAITKLSTALSALRIFGVVTNTEYVVDLLNTPDVRTGNFDTHFIAEHPWQQAVPDAVKAAYASALVSGSGWRLNSAAQRRVTGYFRGERFSAEPSDSGAVTQIDGDDVWIHLNGNWVINRRNPRARSRHSSGSAIESPMPGVVVAALVSEGESVSQGDPLVVIEAMKMEHVLRAPCDGVVSRCTVAVGDRVQARQVLLEVK